jgi:hypothetical protein
MYKHQGISYPTAAAAIAEAIYDYVTLYGKNTTKEALGLASHPAERIRAALEARRWSPDCGTLADWQAARVDVIRRLQDEQSE